MLWQRQQEVGFIKNEDIVGLTLSANHQTSICNQNHCYNDLYWVLNLFTILASTSQELRLPGLALIEYNTIYCNFYWPKFKFKNSNFLFRFREFEVKQTENRGTQVEW